MFKELEVFDVPDILKTLHRLMGAIIEDVTLNAKPIDLMRLAIECPSLDYPIIIPFGQIQNLTADTILSEIERVIQSNEDFILDEGLKLEITHVDMPEGGAGKRCKYVNTDQFLVDKRCIIRIQNEDDLCCALRLVTAKVDLTNTRNGTL